MNDCDSCFVHVKLEPDVFMMLRKLKLLKHASYKKLVSDALVKYYELNKLEVDTNG